MTQGVPGSPYTPTALTPEVRKIYLAAARSLRGSEACAALAGIDSDTVRNWRREIESGRVSPELSAFFGDVARARAEGANEILRTIRTHADKADGDWRAGAWLLERLARDEFGAHNTVEIVGDADGARATAMKEALRGMDWFTRRKGRTAVIEAACSNGTAAENGHSNGHAKGET